MGHLELGSLRVGRLQDVNDARGHARLHKQLEDLDDHFRHTAREEFVDFLF